MDKVLNEVFLHYAATKSLCNSSHGIISARFIKMCSDALLLNEFDFKREDADVLFVKVKKKGKSKLDFLDFKVAQTIYNFISIVIYVLIKFLH